MEGGGGQPGLVKGHTFTLFFLDPSLIWLVSNHYYKHILMSSKLVLPLALGGVERALPSLSSAFGRGGGE